MNKWIIGIKERGEDVFDLSNLTVLESPEGHYWADPFLAEENGKTYLFFEDYDYVKGRLAYVEILHSSLGAFVISKESKIILDEEKHVSFPSVIKLDGEWYMTPERCLAGELVIYKATQFPDIWEPICTVANGRFDDPILRRTDNGYELWCSEDGDKLRVFASRSLTGGWGLIKSHDEQYARAAGHFQGFWRPTQDSVPVYGQRILIKRDDVALRAIEPTWYPDLTGTHTFNTSDKFVVIDGRIKI